MKNKKWFLPKLALILFILTVLLIVIVRPPANPLWKVDRWHYQLQGYGSHFSYMFSNVKNTLLVVDYSRDGTEQMAFKPDEVELMRNQGKNTALAYLSIGEAEEYRYYFDGIKKSLNLIQNRNFKNNHIVEYWRPEWQKVIVDADDSYLDRIINAGFDGVYLDIVDAYEYFRSTNKNAAEDMINLIHKISLKGKARKRNFILVAQNAPCILDRGNFQGMSDKDYNATVDKYNESIDGISLESTFYFGKSFEDNAYNPQREVLDCLDFYFKNRKRVLGVEYLSNQSKFIEANELMTKAGFLSLVTDRKLEGKVNFYADKRTLK